MRPHHYLVLLAAGAALVGGLLVSTRLHDPSPQEKGAGMAGKGETLLASTFADLNGHRQPLSQWRGKVLVVNFWATWCPPCRAEIPGFIKLQRELADKNVQFVGIAIDQLSKVTQFASELGANYPLLLGEDSAFELLGQLGNQAGVLPFTIVIDSRGTLVLRQMGEVHADQLRSTLVALAVGV